MDGQVPELWDRLLVMPTGELYSICVLEDRFSWGSTPTGEKPAQHLHNTSGLYGRSDLKDENKIVRNKYGKMTRGKNPSDKNVPDNMACSIQHLSTIYR